MQNNMIKMQFEDVCENAKVYGEVEQEIIAMLTKLHRTQENLKGAWSGKAMQAFDQQYGVLVPKVQDFAKLMKSIEIQLLKIAQAMHDMDIQLHQSILNES